MCVLDIAGEVLKATNIGRALTTLEEQRKMGNYQAALMAEEARKSEKEAAYQRQEGIEEARRPRLSAILKMGDKKAVMASNNIALTSATAMNAVDDEKLNGELNALTTLKKSEYTAQSYIDRANDYYRKAGLQSFKAKNNYRSGLRQLGTDLEMQFIKGFIGAA